MAVSPKLQQLIAEARAKHAAKLAGTTLAESHASALPLSPSASPSPSASVLKETLQTPIHITQDSDLQVSRVLTEASGFHSIDPTREYNEKQIAAIELAMRGKSLNLIGAAGTGKTTTTREIISQLVRLPHIEPIKQSTKHLSKDAPGIVVISFTNKAVNNLKQFLPDDLKKHCLTYHKLLQYEPVRYLKEPGNPMGGSTMRFEPAYGETNKLPHISCVIVEESSMVDADILHTNLIKALPFPEKTQFIFLGDLNQLPPIFGPSILGFKLLELQTVELTHVYRQALQSPIITLAHQIREGKGFLDKYRSASLGTDPWIDDRDEHGKVTLHPWKKKQNPIQAVGRMKLFLVDLLKTGKYDPDRDMILCPFNKSFGTLELNKAIAEYLGKQRQEEIYEVIARGTRSYWSVGDKVLVDRREARILSISPTPGYNGPVPVSPSLTLNRWGFDSAGSESHTTAEDTFNLIAGEDIDVLDQLEQGDEEQAKNSASHTIKVEFLDNGGVYEVSASGEVNAMVFAYILTVHKSQGSEWDKVFILLHYSHNTMLSRELLYTAVTRAKKELFIVCEPDRKDTYNSITRAAKNPEIVGVTLEEKAAYFKRKKGERRAPPTDVKGERVLTKGEAWVKSVMTQMEE